MEIAQMSGVSSYTEWQPLEEVIVGRVFDVRITTFENSFKLFFNDNLESGYFFAIDEFDLPNKFIEEGQEDIEGFVEVLQAEGITVRRPAEVDSEPVMFTTPYDWRGYLTPPLNIRDQTLIWGNKIVETPPLLRTRVYENDFLKPLFYEYMDAGATWFAAPRPMMTDNSFDDSYVRERNPERVPPRVDSPFDIGFEMMIDAAQCLRFGEDIVVNVANENHRMGLRWLRSVLPEVRFHEVQMADSHIDSRIIPLRPGKLMVDVRWPGAIERLPEALKRWDVIPVTREVLAPDLYQHAELSLASVAININVLSLDEERVIVNEAAPRLIRLLEHHGFTPIPVRFRHGRVLAGAFHCITLDVRRRGPCEKYLD